MIKDEAGNEATYWPITNLPSDEDSYSRLFKIDTPVNGLLYSNNSSSARVICNCTGAGISEQDLASDPIDLSSINLGPDTVFEIFVRPVEPIVGLLREPLSVGVGIASPAGWDV